MGDFTKTIIAIFAFLIFIQIARLVSKIIGNGISEMGFGALLLYFGYQIDIPYLSNGLRIFGGCLILVGFIAIIGSGAEVGVDVNDKYDKEDQYFKDEKINMNDVSIEITDEEFENNIVSKKKSDTDKVEEIPLGIINTQEDLMNLEKDAKNDFESKNTELLKKSQKPTNVEEMSLLDGVLYSKDTNRPFNGPAIMNFYDIKLEGVLKDGKADGEWNAFYPSGRKYYQRNYKDGELINSIMWDQEGKIIEND